MSAVDELDDRDDSQIEFSDEEDGVDDRYNWARRYDDLNGAPEGPDDY